MRPYRNLTAENPVLKRRNRNDMGNEYEYNRRLEVKMRKAEWRRNKYWSNAEFRELEKARSKEYQRKKRMKEDENKY